MVDHYQAYNETEYEEGLSEDGFLRVSKLGATAYGFRIILINVENIILSSFLTLLHSEWPKLHRVLAILSAIGLMSC